ncbi:hypothetical protein DFQ09_102246 [Winogradskyella pacifica]|uniref:Uncharacterized protein n=1 Tax=Winogradskyella pacifica TaxID=664642 RepID=A0A3D9MZ92_9FLAO|nr:hypothetical protein [Winogradskyella pacifica]REE25655.1 hypothetical protein DFQ09_102246 [Winogradskyella pacifica]
MKKIIVSLIVIIIAVSAIIYCYDTYLLDKNQSAMNRYSHCLDCVPITSCKSLDYWQEEFIGKNRNAEDVKRTFHKFKIIEDGNDLIVINGVINGNYSGNCPNDDEISHAYFSIGKRYIVWGDIIVKDIEIYDNEDIEKYVSIAKENNVENSQPETSGNQTEDSKIENKYCSLTMLQTFDYLNNNSPFNLGSSGSVNFTKRFDYERNSWVEGEINISGGLGSNSRLSGKYTITSGNILKISGLSATGGSFDASRNGDSFGSFKINCSGDLEGYLRDYNGNTKNVKFLKN